MEHKGTKTIETERLILRAFRAEDAGPPCALQGHAAFLHDFPGVRIAGIVAGVHAVHAHFLKKVGHHGLQRLRGDALSPKAAADAVAYGGGFGFVTGLHDADAADRLPDFFQFNSPLIIGRLTVPARPEGIGQDLYFVPGRAKGQGRGGVGGLGLQKYVPVRMLYIRHEMTQEGRETWKTSKTYYSKLLLALVFCLC